MRHAWEAARKIPRRFDYIGYLNIIPICVPYTIVLASNKSSILHL